MMLRGPLLAVAMFATGMAWAAPTPPPGEPAGSALPDGLAAESRGNEREAPPSAPCWDLAATLKAATRDDPRIAQSREGIARAQGQLRVAKGAMLPQVSLFSRVGAGQDSFNAEGQFDNRGGVRASQLLFDFGQADARRDAARARLNGSNELDRQQILDIAAEAARHHLAITRAEARAVAARDMAGHYRRQFDTVAEQLAAGLLKRSEAVAVRAEAMRGYAAQAEELLLAEQERIGLRTLVGSPVACVDAASAEQLLASTMPATLDEALDESLRRAPAIQAAEAQAAAARQDARREKASHLPELRASATTAYSFGFNGTVQGRSDRFGLDVSMPLYQGGQLGGQAAASEADARAAGYAVAQKRRELIEQITLSWSRVEKLRQVAVFERNAVQELAAQSQAMAEEFQSQLITFNELISARKAEYDMRNNEIDTNFKLQAEKLNIILLTGRLAEFTGTTG